MNHLPQPRQEQRTRWFWPSRLLLAAVLLVGMSGRAHAEVGLNGIFAPGNWSLLNSDVGELDSNSYVCGSTLDGYEVGCISDQATSPDAPPPAPADPSTVFSAMQNPGNIFIIGSNRDYLGGGSDGIESTTEFTVKNTGNPVNLSFAYSFQGFNTLTSSSYPYPSFTITAGDYSFTQISDASTPTYSGVFSALLGNRLLLLKDKDLTFKITTYNNALADPLSDYFTTPSLVITNFQTQEVPAPLPALGAASAFACSRRLRRRINQAHPSRQTRTSKPLPPDHPTRPVPAASVPVSLFMGTPATPARQPST